MAVPEELTVPPTRRDRRNSGSCRDRDTGGATGRRGGGRGSDRPARPGQADTDEQTGSEAEGDPDSEDA